MARRVEDPPRRFAIIEDRLKAMREMRVQDSMHPDDFDAQMEPFLAALEDYGWHRAEAMPSA